MVNRAFWRALHSLSHPLSLGAMLLLLVNDHILRWQSPSWFTGKLGDFTWLIFAPFIAALVFAWVIPARWREQERHVRNLALGFIGLWFATAKTIPAVHHLTMQTLYFIVGWEGSLRLDVTDLLTLPALLVSAYIWQVSANSALNLRPVAYAALGVGLLGTLANSPAPPAAVPCIFQNGSLLEHKGFVSEDGGLTWQTPAEPIAQENASSFCGDAGGIIITRAHFSFELPINDQTHLRFETATAIQISHDQGQTWQTELDLSFLQSELRRVYYSQGFTEEDRPPSTFFTGSGPFSALYHAPTGNVVVDMGVDGMLVRTPDGVWQWVALGNYRLTKVDNQELGKILLPEFYRTMMLGVCLFVFPLRLPTIRGWLTSGVFILWLICAIFPPSKWYTYKYGIIFDPMVIIVTLALLLYPIIAILECGLVVSAIVNHTRTVHFKRLQLALAAMLGYLLPYLLWFRGLLAELALAHLIALLLGVTIGIGGLFYLWDPTTELEKTKPKNEG